MPADWLNLDCSGTASRAGQGRAGHANHALFSDALARLFYAKFTDDVPPNYLQAMLAVEHWLPIALPMPAGGCHLARWCARPAPVSTGGDAAVAQRLYRARRTRAEVALAYRVVLTTLTQMILETAVDRCSRAVVR